MHVGAPDPTRIAAQVVSGIGFIGAGIIFRQSDRGTGLTTAATVWATAAVGMAVAYKMLVLPTLMAILLHLLLALHHWTRPPGGGERPPVI
jgi:putative Mg2+ transporter-C (MgtC) family protein